MTLAAHFALFVSSVEGCPTTRFGTGTLIGATRTRANPRVIEYQTDQIVALTHAEYARYRREYSRAIRDGALRVRSVEEWQAQAEPTPPEAA